MGRIMPTECDFDSIMLCTEKYNAHVHVWCDRCQEYIGRWIGEKPLSSVIDLITGHDCEPLEES